MKLLHLGLRNITSKGGGPCSDSTGQIQPVEAFDSTSSVNNSEGFFQL